MLSVKKLMENMKWTLEQALNALGIQGAERDIIAKNIMEQWIKFDGNSMKRATMVARFSTILSSIASPFVISAICLKNYRSDYTIRLLV